MPTKSKQPKKPKTKKTVPNVIIAERINLNIATKRRAQMIRQAPKPAGIDTAEILNKGYLLQKAITSKIIPQTQSQSINLYLDSYGQLEKQQQIRRIDDDIQAFRIKGERGVDASITNPAIARLQQQRRNLPQQQAPSIDVYDPISQRQYASESEVKQIQPVKSTITGGVLQRTQFATKFEQEITTTKELEGSAPAPVRRAGRPPISRSVEATEFIAQSPEVAKQVALIYESQRKKEQARIRTKLEGISDEPPATGGGGVRGRQRRTNIDAGSAIAERQTELSRAQPAQLTRADQGQQESIFGGGPAVPIRLRRTKTTEPEAQSQLRTSQFYSPNVDYEESESSTD